MPDIALSSNMPTPDNNIWAQMNPTPNQSAIAANTSQVNPGTANMIAMANKTGMNSKNPIDMSGSRTPSAAPASKKIDQDISTSKSFMGADQLAKLREAAEAPGGALDEQKKGIQNQQDLLGLQAQNGLANSGGTAGLDLSPMMAWVDAQNAMQGKKTNLAGAYTAPTDQSAAVGKGLADLQKQKGEFSKEETSTLKNMVDGSNTSKTLDQLGGLGGLSGLAETRRNNAIAAAGAVFDKDPILKQVTTTGNSLDRATSIMNGTTPVTGKNFALLQQDMINAMAPGGAASEGKVNREMVSTLAAKLNDIQTQFGSIQDLRKEQPAVFAQLQSLINQVQADYHKAGMDRANQIAQNYGHVNDPDMKATVADKMSTFNKRYAPDPVVASASPTSGPTVGSVEDGHRFKGGNPADAANWEAVK